MTPRGLLCLLPLGIILLLLSVFLNAGTLFIGSFIRDCKDCHKEKIKSRNFHIKAIGDIILIIIICFNISCLIYRRKMNYTFYGYNYYPRHTKKFDHVNMKNDSDGLENQLFDPKSTNLTERLTFDV